MSRRRNRGRRRNDQPPVGRKSWLQKKSPFQKRCYCNANGFSKLLKFLKKKTPAPGLGLGHLRAQKQESKASKNNKEGDIEVELVFDATSLPPKTTARVVASRINLCYTNGIYTNHCAPAAGDDNLGLCMDCLEAMDWEHTCPHTSRGEKHLLPRSREQISFSRENLNPWSGDDWRMEWFPGPDMMDLSYESCRE